MLAFPLKLTATGAATNDADSADDLLARANTIVCYPVGFLVNAPTFGVDDQMFATIQDPQDAADTVAQGIMASDPEIACTVTGSIDGQGDLQLDIQVSNGGTLS